MQSLKTGRGQQRLREDPDVLWWKDPSPVPNIAVKSSCRVLTQSPVRGRLNQIKLCWVLRAVLPRVEHCRNLFCNHHSLTRRE